MMVAEPPRRERVDDLISEFFIVGCPRSGTTLLRRIEAICVHEMAVYGYRRDTSVRERLPLSLTVLPAVWRKRVRRMLRRRRTENMRSAI